MEYTNEEKAMKHVITLSLITLRLGAMADATNDLPNTISKLQTMIAIDLNIPIWRVGELFEVVLKDLKHFDEISEEARDLVSRMS